MPKYLSVLLGLWMGVTGFRSEGKAGDTLELEDHCDSVGETVGELSVPAPHDCQLKCQQQSACEGFTFISGWNRCFLRKQVKQRKKVSMHSAELGNPALIDHDYTGKDLLAKAAPSPEACDTLCRGHKSCLAFTYIAGYSTCWLKKTKGKMLPKIFYCGGPEKLARGGAR